jgi:hypothetical protein
LSTPEINEIDISLLQCAALNIPFFTTGSEIRETSEKTNRITMCSTSSVQHFTAMCST